MADKERMGDDELADANDEEISGRAGEDDEEFEDTDDLDEEEDVDEGDGM